MAGSREGLEERRWPGGEQGQQPRGLEGSMDGKVTEKKTFASFGSGARKEVGGEEGWPGGGRGGRQPRERSQPNDETTYTQRKIATKWLPD